jgi:hypothetical protein
MTTLREKLIENGAKVVRHEFRSEHVVFHKILLNQ